MATDQRQGEPTGLKATKGIELLTYSTPNGYKASIMLEELKLAYPGKFDYSWQAVSIMKNTQKEPWFVELCPNGRIPVIVDHDRSPGEGGKKTTVWEGIAILGYLGRRYDPEHKIAWEMGSDEYDEAEVWMGWQHGGIGPMQGQAHHFVLFSPHHIPYASQRYVGEVERLYGILNTRLSGRNYVVGPNGGRFSIADISLLGWAAAAKIATIDMAEKFPNVKLWLDRCLEREGVRNGFGVPSRNPLDFDTGSEEFKRMASGNEFLRSMGERMSKAKEDVEKAKEEFGYVYKSP